MSAPVVVNARAAVRTELGGVERWARELARRLPALRPERYRLAAPPPALAHRAGQAWEQTLLPLVARGCLLVSPANLAPLAHPRNVVVIHDLAPLRGPEWYGRAYGTWHRAVVPRLARRAALVIVPSRYVADELIALVGVEPERVRVVSPGVSLTAAADQPSRTPEADPTDHRPGEPRGASQRAPAGSVPAIDGPYVLAVGTESARKNLALLDELAPRLRSAGLDVVIAGGRRGYLRATAGTGAHRLGYVSDATLAALYANAAVLAMPSLYEGFGLPCIEAMAAGAPVVASNRAALPETCGAAALLADPRDAESFAAAILAAAQDEETRGRLVAAGRERAAAFTWARTASGVDAAIDELLGT